MLPSSTVELPLTSDRLADSNPSVQDSAVITRIFRA
jgi:hypothetical protein